MVVSYQDVWKEVFLAGTDWSQYADVDKYVWDFEHIEEALADGVLKSGDVYFFGTTEPQLVPTESDAAGEIIPIPVIVAIVSSRPPPSLVGIKSVQKVEEEILDMSKMKMGWYPYIPPGADPARFTRKRPRLYALKCEQRRAGLRNLAVDRVRKYEYVLPYIYFPDRQKDEEVDSVVNLLIELEEGKKPLMLQYDWELDDLDDFVRETMENEELEARFEDALRAQIKAQVAATRAQLREERAARKRRDEQMDPAQREALRTMKVIKFYPQNKEPNVQPFKTPFINRYYGAATEVL